MPFHCRLKEILILNTVVSILYVQSNETLPTSESCRKDISEGTKLIYMDVSLNEDEAIETWRVILSDPLTDNKEILKGIKQGKCLSFPTYY